MIPAPGGREDTQDGPRIRKAREGALHVTPSRASARELTASDAVVLLPHHIRRTFAHRCITRETLELHMTVHIEDV